MRWPGFHITNLIVLQMDTLVGVETASGISTCVQLAVDSWATVNAGCN